jgi:hypothetical protein
MSWQLIKELIIRTVGVSEDHLHTYIGVLIYAAAIVLLQSFARRWLTAFIAVAAVELINEGLDIVDWANGHAAPNWLGGLLDVFHTLCLPLVLTLALSSERRRD